MKTNTKKIDILIDNSNREKEKKRKKKDANFPFHFLLFHVRMHPLNVIHSK